MKQSIIKSSWDVSNLMVSDDKSTLVQVMTWCRQATSHYLSQCWPSHCQVYLFTAVCVSSIKMMLHEHHDITNHRQINCLFNSLFRLTTKEIPKHRITGPLWRESTNLMVIQQWPVVQEVLVMRKMFQWHGFFMIMAQYPQGKGSITYCGTNSQDNFPEDKQIFVVQNEKINSLI